MADWSGWWRYVRHETDQSETGEVTFSVGEIRAGARCRDNSLHEPWWWGMPANSDNSTHTGLIENGMECTPLPESGPVQRVTFRLTR